MTNREFLTAISTASVIETEYMNATREDLIAFAQAEIAKLDARNDKRRNTLSKEQEANVERKALIVEVLNDKPMLASEIATATNLSTQRVSALCKQLVDEDKIKVADVKVKGKGTLKQYSLAE